MDCARQHPGFSQARRSVIATLADTARVRVSWRLLRAGGRRDSPRRVSRDRVDAAVARPERAAVADRAWGVRRRDHRAGDRLRDWPVERYVPVVLTRRPAFSWTVGRHLVVRNVPRRAA